MKRSASTTHALRAVAWVAAHASWGGVNDAYQQFLHKTTVADLRGEPAPTDQGSRT